MAGGRRHPGPIDGADSQLRRASASAGRARDLLAQPATLDCCDWLLAATLLVEAAEALERARSHDPAARLPLLDSAVEELREATSDFTRPEFLRASRPARRQKPSLFAPRGRRSADDLRR